MRKWRSSVSAGLRQLQEKSLTRPTLSQSSFPQGLSVDTIIQGIGYMFWKKAKSETGSHLELL